MGIKMRRKVKVLVYMVLLFVIFFDLSVLYSSGETSSVYEEKLKQAEEKRKELEASKKEAQAKLDELKNDRDNIMKYIEELDIEFNEIMLRIEQYEKDIAVKESELNETRILLEEARQTEARQYATMKKRIQYMYENGDTGFLEILLNTESLSELLNQTEYFSKITQYDKNLLEDYTETKLLIADREAILELDLEMLSELKEAADFEKKSTETLIAEKTNEIEKYTASIGVTDEILFQYMDEIVNQDLAIEDIKAEEAKRIEEEEKLRKEEEERLAKEQKEREEQAERDRQNGNALAGVTTSETSLPEDMIWPLPGDYRIYSYFGYRVAPTEGASTYHRGLDIGGEYGASIVSVLAGTVEVSSYSTTSGNYVIVNHGNGLRTAYLHNSKNLVSVGDYVKQGTVVGLVGSTGVSTGPHLHFGVSVNGTYVDPLNYLGKLL